MNAEFGSPGSSLRDWTKCTSLFPSLHKILLIHLSFGFGCKLFHNREAAQQTLQHRRRKLHREFLAAIEGRWLSASQISDPVDKVEGNVFIGSSPCSNSLFELAEHSAGRAFSLHQPSCIEAHLALGEPHHLALLFTQDAEGRQHLRESIQYVSQRQVVIKNSLARLQASIRFTLDFGTQTLILHYVVKGREAQHGNQPAPWSHIQLKAAVIRLGCENTSLLKEIEDELPVEVRIEVQTTLFGRHLPPTDTLQILRLDACRQVLALVWIVFLHSTGKATAPIKVCAANPINCKEGT
mmetsp:Transcript_23660/g.55167  ORF Transcript_23660/g.55167 Transcript_23660/m.55167 type:complete len:296 (+) Transcript_23660:567-1454(+)